MVRDPSRPARPLLRWVVLLGLCLVAVLAYIQRNAISVVKADLCGELDLEDTELGWIMGAFFLPYALAQVPTAWLGQRWGMRQALALYVLLSTVFTAATAFCTDFLSLTLMRVGLGITQAGLFPCAAAIIALWFPIATRGLATGWLGASMSIGAAVASALTAQLLQVATWQTIFLLYAVPGLLWAGWFLLFFRDQPSEHSSENTGELDPGKKVVAASLESGLIPWRAILASPTLWWLCGQQFFRAAGYIFFGTWFPSYLRESREVSIQQAGWLTSLPLLGVVVGSVAGGWWSDWILLRTGSRLLSRQWLAAAALLACAGCIVLAWFIDDDVQAVLLITAGSLLGSVAGPCAYSSTMDRGGRNLPTIFALTNMSGNLGAWAFPVLIPYLVLWMGTWDVVLFSFAGIHVAAAWCWLVMPQEGKIG